MRQVANVAMRIGRLLLVECIERVVPLEVGVVVPILPLAFHDETKSRKK